MQDTMLKKLFNHVHHHAKLYHHKITNHPHYELMVGHAFEIIAVIGGSFLAISFGSSGSLPTNDSFIYPLQTVSRVECRSQSFNTLKANCLMQLPRIKGANFEAYRNNSAVRSVYTTLYGSSYNDAWDHAGGHSGTDFATSQGTPVVSVGNGIVVIA